MVERPDLDEFLTALTGFLDEKTAVPSDPSYLRFVEIFCRSVGSSEGHLLQMQDGQGLKSLVDFGLPSEFEKVFNDAAQAPGHEPSPLDIAYRESQVVAMVELKNAPHTPDWFMKIADKYKFKSLIAVPLIGQSRAVGVLCAYYRDVCLFDQATMDRLMTIGRMVGAAMEKTMVRGAAAAAEPASLPAVDLFLEMLTTRTATKAHVFEALTQVLAKSLSASGVVVGPLRVGSDLTMTIADGTGIPPQFISQRVPIPVFLAQSLMLGSGGSRQDRVALEQWGQFRPLMAGKTFSAISQPIVWQKQPQAAIIAWRGDRKPFVHADEVLLTRLSQITALALRAI